MEKQENKVGLQKKEDELKEQLLGEILTKLPKVQNDKQTKAYRDAIEEALVGGIGIGKASGLVNGMAEDEVKGRLQKVTDSLKEYKALYETERSVVNMLNMEINMLMGKDVLM